VTVAVQFLGLKLTGFTYKPKFVFCLGANERTPVWNN